MLLCLLLVIALRIFLIRSCNGGFIDIVYYTNLPNITYSVTNSSNISATFENETMGPQQIDCLGLGKTVASTLEWFFGNKINTTNAPTVKFYLTSRKQAWRVQVYVGKQFGLEWTDFKVERRTIFIVHGFLSHGQEKWIMELEQAFLEWDDVNVVVVDWSERGNTWNYLKAAINTKIVGHQISKFIEHSVNATTELSNWGPVHLVGHSLGAHICGFAAKELKKKYKSWSVFRITGLDPAQPCFRNTDTTVHLNKNDAKFVDVIHTNGRLLSKLGLGLPEAIGHVDFYPNGGKTQPGCVKDNTTYFNFLPVPSAVIQRVICSHGRSYVYFTESLIMANATDCTFWAHHWDSTYRNINKTLPNSCNKNNCTQMGINAENYAVRGTFFLVTSNSPPFCINGTDIPEEVKTQLEADHADELED